MLVALSCLGLDVTTVALTRTRAMHVPVGHQAFAMEMACLM